MIAELAKHFDYPVVGEEVRLRGLVVLASAAALCLSVVTPCCPIAFVLQDAATLRADDGAELRAKVRGGSIGRNEKKGRRGGSAAAAMRQCASGKRSAAGLFPAPHPTLPVKPTRSLPPSTRWRQT